MKGTLLLIIAYIALQSGNLSIFCLQTDISNSFITELPDVG
ncbi:hypothetical protein M153_6261000121, partial [Pseudoloma neurophilia]